MTVQEQREKILESLARIETKIEQSEKNHTLIIKKLDLQNGRVRENENKISKITGYGLGVAFVLGLAISLVALFV